MVFKKREKIFQAWLNHNLGLIQAWTKLDLHKLGPINDNCFNMWIVIQASVKIGSHFVQAWFKLGSSISQAYF